MTLKPAVIGIDTGGTKLAAHISDGTLWSAAALTRPTPAAAQPAALAGLQPGTAAHTAALEQGRAALLAALSDIGRALLAEAAALGVQIVAVGVGSAGQIDPVAGCVVDANENLVGWKGTPVAAALRAALGVPVYVENDVRAMLLAETTLGAAHEYAHVLGVAIGTGIGGALVLHGRIWHGAHYSAGEIGYVQAAPGHSIEDLYAGPAIARRYCQQHAPQADFTLVEIARRAHAGDATCAAAIASAAADLGAVLAPVFGLIDPQAVVIGGGVPAVGGLWWQPFTAAIRAARLKNVQQLPILPARLGPDAGRIGAARLAAQKAGLL
ncbi:MAG: ROK family protein [Anaerolineae bacterium]|jgi:glucokinase|nr:ROK family protein [Anaerolineae bacterium]